MSTISKIHDVETSVASSAGDVDAFLAKVKTLPKTNGEGRLLFAMDATMSRQATWDQALSIQGQMFMETGKTGGLSVQLLYFRGFNECRASHWVDNPETLARLMTKVDCRGGNTQIGRVLKHIKNESAAAKVNAAIFVGDACEEGIDGLCQTAGEIALLGVPVFMFQEGSDAAAEKTFREIAKLTRGAYFKFDGSSPKILADLLAAVAAYATGGRAALEAKGSSTAKTLLKQLK